MEKEIRMHRNLTATSQVNEELSGPGQTPAATTGFIIMISRSLVAMIFWDMTQNDDWEPGTKWR